MGAGTGRACLLLLPVLLKSRRPVSSTSLSSRHELMISTTSSASARVTSCDPAQQLRQMHRQHATPRAGTRI